MSETESASSFGHVTEQTVRVDYVNHRGERRERHIMPLAFFYSRTGTKWHPEPGHFLSCVDQETGENRIFAMSGIKSWTTA